MKRTHILTSVALATLYLSSAAQAGQIFLDNGIHIYDYEPGGVPPGNTTRNDFSDAPGTKVLDMAFTLGDTTLNPTTPAYVLLAADNGGADIYAYTLSGAQSVFASVSNPIGLAVGANGWVFTGANNGTVVEALSPTGNSIEHTFVSSGVQIQSLAVDAAGDVFALDNNSGYVIEYFAGGGSKNYSSTVLPDGGNFGMTFDSNGDLFVTYQATLTTGGIYEITPNGTVTSFFLGSGVPTSLAYDNPSGNLYMSYLNTANGTGGGIDQITSGGVETNFATIALGQPDAVADLAPEPGSFLLLGCGLISVSLFHFRRVRQTAPAKHDRA